MTRRRDASSAHAALDKSALRLLAHLALVDTLAAPNAVASAALVAADLAIALPGGGVAIADTGRAYLARQRQRRSRRAPTASADAADAVDPFRAQHMALATHILVDGETAHAVAANDGESPLAWLARRKGRGGQALISPTQLIAGERLRADFTRAQMMPRMSANWEAPVARGARGAREGMDAGDIVVGARQRVRAALDAAGPEFAGLLLDVCCFLRGLDDIERARGWPSRSAKVVVQLALDRLARHYGVSAGAQGPDRARPRAWSASHAVRRSRAGNGDIT